MALAIFGVTSLAAPGAVAQEDEEQGISVIQRQGNSDYHVVGEGDTLYDLSGVYLRDVYEWPRLWSYNPHITNPHYIYPGDIIYLRPGEDQAQVAPTPAVEQRVIKRSRSRAQVFHLAVGGYIATEEEGYIGRIVASPKQANLLAEDDQVWIGFGENAYTDEERDDLRERDIVPTKSPEEKEKVGTVYAIVRNQGSIVDPDDDDKVIGYKYMLLGALRVTELSDQFLHTATIVQSWQEIQRGDFLIPYDAQLKEVSPVKSDRNLSATIVDTVNPRNALGEFHYVIVDQGEEQGVKVGHRFFVYQKNEGLKPLDKNIDEQVPYSYVGQVFIIDVKENHSTAIVADSRNEIFKGDILKMYEGY